MVQNFRRTSKCVSTLSTCDVQIAGRRSLWEHKAAEVTQTGVVPPNFVMPLPFRWPFVVR
jgi:hypothetical protein